jgi:hypothetical protein
MGSVGRATVCAPVNRTDESARLGVSRDRFSDTVSEDTATLNFIVESDSAYRGDQRGQLRLPGGEAAESRPTGAAESLILIKYW